MRLSLLWVMIALPLGAQIDLKERAEWNRPVKPFRIIGNVYYVGAANVSAFLIRTSAGEILLDGGFPETAPEIEKNVADLGFKMADVKILLSSHAHYDHCGGLEELKRASHAKMIVSEGDSHRKGNRREMSCTDRKHSFPAVAVDQTIADGETVRLGDSVMTAHITPGHTRGCTTWSTAVTENGKQYQTVFYCSTTVAGNRLVNNREYPRIVADYRRSFAFLRTLPCDVFLAAHGYLFDLDEKRAALDRGNKLAFVDSGKLAKVVDESEKDFNRQLAEQQRRK